MKGEVWAALWLVLGCSLWLIYLLRAELQLACAAPPTESEGMISFTTAYTEPREPPLTKSSVPGKLGAFDPYDRYAPADVAAPAPAPSPAPAFALSSSRLETAPAPAVEGPGLAPFPVTTR